MENQNTNQQFKEDEIAYIRRWDKELKRIHLQSVSQDWRKAPAGSRRQ